MVITPGNSDAEETEMPRLLTGADIKNFYNSGAMYLVLADGEFMHVTPDRADTQNLGLKDVITLPHNESAKYFNLLDDFDDVWVLLNRGTIRYQNPNPLRNFFVWDDAGNLRDGELDYMAEFINRNSSPILLAEWDAYVESVAQEARDLADKAQQDAADAQESAMERARAVARLAKLCSSGQAEAARRLGLDATTVNKLVRKVAEENRRLRREAGLIAWR